VLIGPAVSDAEWCDAVDQAIAEPGDWAVQRMARPTIYEFPVVQPDRTIGMQPSCIW